MSAVEVAVLQAVPLTDECQSLGDFGTTTSPGRSVDDRPLLYGLDRPAAGETVCRSAATTGTHCGTVQSARGPMQYVTAPDMPPCAGGDSGGAVWVTRNGGAQIVGVWLGGVRMPDGTDLGMSTRIYPVDLP